jgi:hypothetical protein
MIRETCGTLRGALAHQSGGEDWCGWCLHAERVVRLTAEAIPERPPRPPRPLPMSSAPVYTDAPLPVTVKQAAANAALLDAEAATFSELDWIDEPGGGRHLRRVS